MRLKLIALVCALTLLVAAPAFAQLAVFDPANFGQNTLTAARSLQSNMNQATEIANQVQQLGQQIMMVSNQGRNLQALPDSLLQNYQSSFGQLLQQTSQINGLMGNLSTLQSQYQQQYPSWANSSLQMGQLNTLEQAWRTQDASNYRSALASGATILQQLPTSQADIARLGQDSQNAPGALSAIQAGNNLSVAIAGQLQDLNTQTATFQQAELQHMAADTSGVDAANAAAKHDEQGIDHERPPRTGPASADYVHWAGGGNS